MDAGADLDYYTTEQLKCFPAFIKAEASTQNLDLRPNSKKIKNGEYVPQLIENLAENEVPGTILVQRTNTSQKNATVLEYMEEEKFNKLLEDDNINETEKNNILNHFTINDEGELVIAKWTKTVVDITKDKNYNNLPEEQRTEIEERNNEAGYRITTEPIAYSQHISQYTMPFEFLVQLLVITEEPEFCMELVDYVLDSKIVINIQEEETYTETDETKKYTIHNKDNKYVDYAVNLEKQTVKQEKNVFLDYDVDNSDGNKECTSYSVDHTDVKIHTEKTSHSYAIEVVEADTWIAHYKKTYATQSPKQEPSNTQKVKKDGKYPNEPKTTTYTSHNDIISDEDARYFRDTTETYYTQLIISNLPNINVVENKDSKGNISYTIEVDGVATVTYGTLPDDYSISRAIDNGIIYTYEYYKTYKEGKNEYIWKGSTVECVFSKLEIKSYEKIDMEGTVTTTVTKYPSDPNPKTQTHIYATENEKPGKGANDKNTVFEKFLVAYHNSPGAQNQLNSIDSWIYEMMEENESTVELIDTIKYLLYMYDGKDRGVTELDLSVFEPSEFRSATSGSSAFAEVLKSYENNALRQYMNGESSNYTSVKEYVNADKTQYKLYYTSFDGCLNFSYGIMVRNKYGSLNNESYFTEEGIDLQSLINQYNNGQDVYVDVEIIDRIYLKIISDKRTSLKEILEKNGASLETHQIDALINVAYQYGNCGQYISGENNIANLYNKYYEKDPDVFKNNAVCQTDSGALANFFVTGNYPNREKYNWIMFHEGKYFLADGTEIQNTSEVAEFALQFVGKTHDEIGLTLNNEWCAWFATYCYEQCGLIPEVIPYKSASSGLIQELYNNQAYKSRVKCVSTRGKNSIGATEIESNYIPSPGDLIFFLWDWDVGTWSFSHVGIVTSCDGSKVYTVEGNVNGTNWTNTVVAERNYELDDARILGYVSLSN